jgi:uncharacterized protein YraI
MEVKRLFFILLVILMLAGCSSTPVQPVLVTETPTIGLVFPENTIQPSQTPAAPTATPTLEPVSGLTLWQVNVRSGPGISFPLLGQINKDQPVLISGVDASGEWFAIIYPSGSQELGWVTAQFIQSQDIGKLPVLGLVTLPNGAPAPQAHLTQKLNVRSGPGSNYDPLGILPKDSLVWLIGRNPSASWLMIAYPAAAVGKGWIVANFVQTEDVLALPVVDASGEIIVETSSSQATSIISTPSPNLVPAYQDGDSADQPAVHVSFSPLGIQSFTYSNDVSSPVGDAEDWIEIRPYSSQPGKKASLLASLGCTGNGFITVEIWQGDQMLKDWGSLSCGTNNSQILVDGGSNYLVHLGIEGTSDFRYVWYRFTVINNP